MFDRPRPDSIVFLRFCYKIFSERAGDTYLAYWNFRDVGLIECENENESRIKQPSVQNKRSHSVPITCMQVSVDGAVVVTGK